MSIPLVNSILGYRLSAVKPGMVLISLKYISSPDRKKSILDRCLTPRADTRRAEYSLILSFISGEMWAIVAVLFVGAIFAIKFLNKKADAKEQVNE